MSEKLIDETKCLHCGEGKPGYCEDCVQLMVTRIAELELENRMYKSQIETDNAIIENLKKELKEPFRYRTYKEYLESKQKKGE